MKILLFGSEGNIGKGVIKPLKKRFKVISIDYKKNSKNNRHFLNLDLSKSIKKQRFKGAEANVGIILSFYKTMPRDFNNESKKKFNFINTNILNNCLNICKKFKVKKIIYFSSAAVYAQNNYSKKINERSKKKGDNIFSKFKLNAEKKALKFGKKNGIQIINLRLFNYFDKNGNDLIKNFKKQISTKKIIVNGDGNQSRDFLHIDDMSSVLIKLIANNVGNQTLNLCSGNSTKIKDILNKLNKKRKKKTHISYGKKIKTNFFLVGDNTKLKNLLNWKVKKNFNLFLKKY